MNCEICGKSEAVTTVTIISRKKNAPVTYNVCQKCHDNMKTN